MAVRRSRDQAQRPLTERQKRSQTFREAESARKQTQQFEAGQTATKIKATAGLAKEARAGAREQALIGRGVVERKPAAAGDKGAARRAGAATVHKAKATFRRAQAIREAKAGGAKGREISFKATPGGETLKFGPDVSRQMLQRGAAEDRKADIAQGIPVRTGAPKVEGLDMLRKLRPTPQPVPAPTPATSAATPGITPTDQMDALLNAQLGRQQIGERVAPGLTDPNLGVGAAQGVPPAPAPAAPPSAPGPLQQMIELGSRIALLNQQGGGGQITSQAPAPQPAAQPVQAPQVQGALDQNTINEIISATPEQQASLVQIMSPTQRQQVLAELERTTGIAAGITAQPAPPLPAIPQFPTTPPGEAAERAQIVQALQRPTPQPQAPIVPPPAPIPQAPPVAPLARPELTGRPTFAEAAPITPGAEEAARLTIAAGPTAGRQTGGFERLGPTAAEQTAQRDVALRERMFEAQRQQATDPAPGTAEDANVRAALAGAINALPLPSTSTFGGVDSGTFSASVSLLAGLQQMFADARTPSQQARLRGVLIESQLLQKVDAILASVKDTSPLATDMRANLLTVRGLLLGRGGASGGTVPSPQRPSATVRPGANPNAGPASTLTPPNAPLFR